MSRHKYNLFIVITIGTILGFGLAAQIFRVDFLPPVHENRIKAEWPAFKKNQKVGVLISQFDAWFVDHFGLRNSLIRVADLVKYYILRSPSSTDVIFGQDGWLFLTGEENMRSARQATLFSDADLKRVDQALERRARLLKKQGIIYLFVVAPDPHTIYSEYLPQWATKKVFAKSRYDQIIELASRTKAFDVVDLRPALFAKKQSQDELLYQKTDTHWNALGAFYAYEVIMQKLGELARNSGRADEFARPIPLSHFKITHPLNVEGDLARMLGIPTLIGETRPVLSPVEPAPFQLGGEGIMDFRTTIPAKPNLPRLLAVRDSFFISLWPFVSNHFSEAHYSWKEFDGNLVKTDHPDYLIEEVSERHLNEAMSPILPADGLTE